MSEVLKKWFEPSVEGRIEGRPYDYSTPVAKAYYKPHFKSRIEESSEPHHLKYADQAVQHLEAKEYTDAWTIWLNCKSLVKSHLENVVKIWETIEEKLVTNIPAKFTEWDATGVSPLDCYILDNTVWEIYREAELKATGKFIIQKETSFKKDMEKDYFRVGMATLYACMHARIYKNRTWNHY